MPYSVLNSDRIIASLEILSKRILERFPESGLYQVSKQLLAFGQAALEDSEYVSRPIIPLRIVSGVLVVILILGILWTLQAATFPKDPLSFTELITLLESGINDIIFLGAGLFFLFTFENRIKRRQALNSLHRLRAFAHVIDMHQLHKDPERVLERGELTPSTPNIELDAFELSRYLDYCSELLSLTGKIAGLYAQSADDPVIVDAVADIEQLTSLTSNKVWQKLLILHTLEVGL